MQDSEESARPLIELQLLLDHVFFPLEDKNLKTAIQKFSSTLQHTAHQIIGSIPINIPAVPRTPEEVLDKREELESALDEWTAAIQEMLESETLKKPEVQKSAMDEINFWRNKSATLSAFHQKFSLPQVKQILEMMELARDSYESIAYDKFMSEMAKLNKVYAEAKDNEKFLLTLERQFSNIQKDDLDLIGETLQSLMNGLRLVWTISRHYKDDPMLDLMQCIANEIADHVES